MKKILIFLIDIYKATISKVLEFIFGKGCRYEPTCSMYAREAIDRYGAKKGMRLSIQRISRCHPFSKHNHFDPVPKKVHYFHFLNKKGKLISIQFP